MTTIAELQANINGLTARLFEENNNSKNDRAALLKGLRSIRERLNAAFDDLESGIVGSFLAREHSINEAFGAVTQEKAVPEVLPFNQAAE